MPYKKIWEDNTLMRLGGGIDREFVLFAANGNCGEVGRLMEALKTQVPKSIPAMTPEGGHDDDDDDDDEEEEEEEEEEAVGWSARDVALHAACVGGHEGIVKLLLDGNLYIGDTDTEHRIDGWTALQAAALGGRGGVAQLLLDRGADINAPGAEDGGATALQAAAGGGHLEMVKLLLDRGAKLDHEECIPCFQGLTALQAAAEGGHVEVVKLLLARGAKIGNPEPVAERNGRTTFQAAAGAGHKEIVELLLRLRVPTDTNNVPNIEGDILNAPAAQYVGTMALEAAAKGGHEKIVVLLIKEGANVNASGANGTSVNALKAAADGGHLKLMTVLLDAGAIVYDPDDNQKKNLIHHAVLGRYVDAGNNHDLMYKLVARSAQQALNAVDTSGSTPLHLAVKERHLAAIEVLLGRAADLNKEIQDNFSNTPLQRALQEEQTSRDPTEIVRLLLSKGASTDRIPTTEFKKLMLCPLEYEKESNDCIIVSDRPSHGPSPGRTIEAGSWSGQPPEPWDPVKIFESEERTMVFQKPSSVQDAGPPPSESSLSNIMVPSQSRTDHRSPRTDPGDIKALIFLAPIEHYRDLEKENSSDTVVQWLRLSWTKSERGDKKMKIMLGVPDNKRMLNLKDSSVMLVGYARFSWPSGDTLDTSADAAPASSKKKNEGKVESFDSRAQKVEISWIMRKENETSGGESNKNTNSNRYRASFPLKTFALPTHAIEFVTWLLREVNDRWKELILRARSHQAGGRKGQLEKAGTDPNIIHSLLKDSHEWTRLHRIWQEHCRKAKDLVDKFKNYEALKGEFTHTGRGAGAPLKDPLEKELKILEEDRGKALWQLYTDTKELIQLEFNLVSIHEARSSLKMAKGANEMARSMKRLSWITFIFLPLMFIAGLFGMNVNVLSDNPPWQWYLIVSGPFSVLVIITSILCRYLDKKTLTSTFLSDISGPSDAGSAQDEMDKRTPVYMRWRGKREKPENDPESITHSVGEKGV